MTVEAREMLKVDLLREIQALGAKQALFPAKGGAIDAMVQALEQFNPIPNPLQPENLSTLLGDWQLIYASRGTVVTRRLAASTAIWDAITVKRIWQSLAVDANNQITAENGAEVTLPFVGTWQTRAQGVWARTTDAAIATVSFHAFAVQAVHLWGQQDWQLPELTIPVLELLRNQAFWKTSYLDSEIRIGRGATGNLFVFHRLNKQS